MAIFQILQNILLNFEKATFSEHKSLVKNIQRLGFDPISIYWRKLKVKIQPLHVYDKKFVHRKCFLTKIKQNILQNLNFRPFPKKTIAFEKSLS